MNSYLFFLHSNMSSELLTTHKKVQFWTDTRQLIPYWNFFPVAILKDHTFLHNHTQIKNPF